MRRSGKTTRLVDYAIQSLFSTGYIKVPSIHELKEGLYRESNIIVDEDAGVGDNIQKHLFDVIMCRLEVEHRSHQQPKVFRVNKNKRTIEYFKPE